MVSRLEAESPLSMEDSAGEGEKKKVSNYFIFILFYFILFYFILFYFTLFFCKM